MSRTKNMLTMTPEECVAVLRQHGMKITPKVLIDSIENGAYPFGRIVHKGATGKRKVEIFRIHFCQWLHDMLPKEGVHDAVM